MFPAHQGEINNPHPSGLRNVGTKEKAIWMGRPAMSVSDGGNSGSFIERQVKGKGHQNNNKRRPLVETSGKEITFE
jgi:hypothetical protein